MSIGLGIFFASIVISITLLHINRQKNIKLPTDSIKLQNLFFSRKFLMLTLLVSFVAVCTYFIYIFISSIPNKQDSYEGIKLGMTMKEVRYINGQPRELIKDKQSIFGGFSSPIISSEAIDSTDSIFNYPEWIYKNKAIKFDKANGSVVAISCKQFSAEAFINGEEVSCSPLSGVVIGTLEDSLEERFGKPDISEIDGVTKIIEFKKFNTRFYLAERKVYYLELKVPDWIEGSNLTVKEVSNSGKFDPSTAVEVKSANDFLDSK